MPKFTSLILDTSITEFSMY